METFSSEQNLKAVKKPVALFLHGWPTPAQTYFPLMKKMADTGFVTVAFNQRGFGDTEFTNEKGDAIDDFHLDLFRLKRNKFCRYRFLRDDIAAFIDTALPEGIAVTLVMHDWGSVFGFHLARTKVQNTCSEYCSASDATAPRHNRFF